jgi:hypothetical protein
VKGFPYRFTRRPKANPCMLPHHRVCQGPMQTFAFIQSRLGLESVRGFEDDMVPVLNGTFITPELHGCGYCCITRSLTKGFQPAPLRQPRSTGRAGHHISSCLRPSLPGIRLHRHPPNLEPSASKEKIRQDDMARAPIRRTWTC